jgi:hypothetical protein
MVWLKFDQYVYIAVWLEVRAKNRPEQRKPADMIAPAELCQPFPIDCDATSLHRSAFFPGTMISACRDWYVLIGLLYDASDERLHRHVLERGLHPKLPVNIPRQIDMNLPRPYAGFPSSTH